jgi:hypothetical protein
MDHKASLFLYRPLGTIAGDPTGGILAKPAPGKPLLVETIVQTVIVMLGYQRRFLPRVYQETAEEANDRRRKICNAIFDLVWEENGVSSWMCDLMELQKYADYCDPEEWCGEIRLAMDAARRGYGPEELRTMVALRQTGAGTEPRTIAAAE